MSSVRYPNKVECVVDNFWASFADVIAGRCTDIGDHDAYTKRYDCDRKQEPDAEIKAKGNGPEFVGSESVQSEEMLDQVEPEELDYAENRNTESEGFSVEPPTPCIADDDFAFRLKQAFSSLSSKLVLTEPLPLPTSTPHCHSKISRNLFKVLGSHLWSVGISGRMLRSTLACKSGCFKETSTNDDGINCEPIRCVEGRFPFTGNEKMKIAFQNEIRTKEKCLHELGTRFPNLDCLELHDILDRHRWALKASVAYLKHSKEIPKAFARQADGGGEFTGCTSDDGNSRNENRLTFKSTYASSKLRKTNIDSVVADADQDKGISDECDDSSKRRRRKAAVAAIKLFTRLDSEDDSDDAPEKRKSRRSQSRPPTCDWSKVNRPRKVV